jgi:hypothetical protein
LNNNKNKKIGREGEERVIDWEGVRETKRERRKKMMKRD